MKGAKLQAVSYDSASKTYSLQLQTIGVDGQLEESDLLVEEIIYATGYDNKKVLSLFTGDLQNLSDPNNISSMFENSSGQITKVNGEEVYFNGPAAKIDTKRIQNPGINANSTRAQSLGKWLQRAKSMGAE